MKQANCEQIQTALSVMSASQETPEEETSRHLASCAECSAFQARLEHLELQMNTYRAVQPPDTLESRIKAAIQEATTSPRETVSHRYSRPPMSLSWFKENRMLIRRLSWGAAALLAVTILTVSQQAGRAHSAMKRMGEAAKHIKNVHLIGWNCELKPEIARAVEKGNTQISVATVLPRRVEAWIAEGRWRESQDFDVTVYSAGKVWKNGVLMPKETQPPLLSAFAYRAITGEEPFGKGVPFTSRILDDTALNGIPVTRLLIESQKPSGSDGRPPIQERRLFWLASSTYLPIRMEQMRYTLDRWELDAVLWFEYDQPVPASLFDPAKVKAERHTPVEFTQPSAQTLYRLTNAQYDRYRALLQELATRQQAINADSTATQPQRDADLIRVGAENTAKIRAILTPDQQKLFDDWWYVQPKILDKLSTPEHRREYDRWCAEQQALMNAWYSSLDAETQRHLGYPTQPLKTP